MPGKKTSLIVLIVMLVSACTSTSNRTETEVSTQPITTTQPSSEPASIQIVLDGLAVEDGIALVQKQADNQHLFVSEDGQGALATDGYASKVRTNYMYFKVNDAFPTDNGPLTIQFEYYDKGEGLIIFEYDSSDQDHSQPEYKSISAGFRLNSMQWKTESFVLTDALFAHRQNFGADFRFSAESTPLIIREIKVIQT